MPNFDINSPDSVTESGTLKPPLYTRGNSKIGSGVMHRKNHQHQRSNEVLQGVKPFQPTPNNIQYSGKMGAGLQAYASNV